MTTRPAQREASSKLRELVATITGGDPVAQPHVHATAAESPTGAAANGSEASAKRQRVAADEFLDQFCIDRVPESRVNEFDKYMTSQSQKVSFLEILNWWKMAAPEYPKLAAVARKLLSIPATSAASESVFRYAGLTVTELRNRLSQETVSDILFIRHNDDI